MRAIQRLDPSCNQGMIEAIDKCEQPVKSFKEQNGLTNMAIFECCFPGRSGQPQNGRQSQCEFKNKSKDGKGKGGKDKVDDKELAKQSMETLTSMAFDCAEDTVDMIDEMGKCKNEDRPINPNAVATFRQYRDRLNAKLWECMTPVMQVQANCTDVQYDDIACLKKGIEWSKGFAKQCFMACMPDSLSAVCNMFTGGQQGNNNQMNNRNSGNSNNNNNNNQNMFDPFGK